MADGWICLHRKFLDWEWFDDANTMRLFLYCLLKANHKEKEWRGIMIKRGQFICSVAALSKALRLSASKIRTAINKLESTGEIAIKTTSRNTVVTVLSYDSYQTKSQTESQAESQTDRKQIATNNNDNNDNKLNNITLGAKAPLKVKRKTRLPDDFTLSPEVAFPAENYWRNCFRSDLLASVEFDKFRTHHTANGKTMLDWGAAWKTWYVNAVKFNPAPHQPSVVSTTRQRSLHDDLTDNSWATG